MNRRKFLGSVLGSAAIGSLGGVGVSEAVRRYQSNQEIPSNPPNDSDETDDEVPPIEEYENDLDTEADAASYGALGYFSRESINKIQSGGYVLYIRHEATQSGRDQHKAAGESVSDVPEFSYEECSLQRNLSLEGWRRAADTNKAFDMLGIKFQNAFSSPWCRCHNHASLAVGSYNVVEGLSYIEDDNSEVVGEYVREPDSGNIGIFAHSLGSMELSELMSASSDGSIQEGQALLLDPSKPLMESAIDGPGF